jgi:hypothetical protein
MATQDHTDRLAREAHAIEAECEHVGHRVGALEFCDAPADRLAQRLAQAHALICATYGQPGEGWGMLSDEVRDSYMWAVGDLISAARGDLACMDAERADRAAGGKS